MAGALIGSLLKDAESSDVATAGEGQTTTAARRNAAKGGKTRPGLSGRKVSPGAACP